MSCYAAVDLGTYSSFIATIDPNTGQITMGRAEDGGFQFPSIYYNDGQQELFGLAAADQAAIGDPAFAVHDAKRKAGTGEILLAGLTAERIMARQLQNLIDVFSKQINETIDGVLVAIPANFSDLKRQSLTAACDELGINVVCLKGEPALAAMADFALTRPSGVEALGVLDIGGGTTDACVVEGRADSAEVKVTKGIPQLGGKDFTDALRDKLLIPKILDQNSDFKLEDLDPSERYEFDQKIERMKQSLGRVPEASLALMLTGGKVVVKVTADEYHAAIDPLIDQALDLFENVIQSFNHKVDRAILVGQPMKDPYIANRFADHTKMVGRMEVDPATAVIEGAARVAADMAKQAGKPQGVIPSAGMLRERHPYAYGLAVENAQGELVFHTLIPAGTLYSHRVIEQKFQIEASQPDGVAIEIRQDLRHLGNGEPIDEYEHLVSYPLDNLPQEATRTDRIMVTLKTNPSGVVNIRVIDQVSGQEIVGEFSGAPVPV